MTTEKVNIEYSCIAPSKILPCSHEDDRRCNHPSNCNFKLKQKRNETNK